MSPEAERGDRWVRRFHSADRDAAAGHADAREAEDAVRLVCLPHAGGSASSFFALSQAMPPAVDVFAVQYPGRQERRHERRIEDVGEFADEIAAVLGDWSDRPLALFGHSMGAVIAFEVARKLEEAGGRPPVLLVASGRRAPSRTRPENVHRGGDEDILAELRRLGGTHSRLLDDDEIVRMVLPVIRSDYTAVERYRCAPGRMVGCPILTLVGDADPVVSLDEARAWSEHTTGDFALHTFRGGHFFLESAVREVATLVARRLAVALEHRP
ncbi:Surfactin synthase thioesterase subunit [Streptoalloteichus tenebrarius]|uniref:Surfactin synthase thioesterase subunit n=1 Tax=Streptoalloteichus tenebrarius (strain ATCC 17920 / DSM 40477 / JCM 4838 / CBS 697.72 / NBRC 16177 / NCIMB 11028 / NRRL B-12390 / A12253. 1 / ISP 5477) TaxID=1933 RepID=A0ABT1HTL5_STRSD|nr:alpha/beta fold hydrolase [Streptoalloteichus tenebrarius]MCP2258869.1 Surfactin synthase thioesterase subunit [Streptoalloteichus tenebrarius]BFE99447.1 alpha/beta fold hydrolase [Streptoalloteichus tenebrarius]